MSASALTIEEVKTVSNQILTEFMAYVPDDAILDNYGGPATAMNLLPCSTKGLYQWPGSNEALVVPGTDLQAVLDKIYTDWRQKEGWTVFWETTPGGNPYLELDRDDGYHFSMFWYVSEDLTKTEISIGSFSPCIAVPDYDPFKEY